MHLYFSGIGGTAIGPLALIAQAAGYAVSGSDKQDSQYVQYLRRKRLDIQIGQTEQQITQAHKARPIDWFVYSSAVAIENSNAPELAFCRQNNIRMSKRDELLNEIISQKELKLIAIAGTHGKTTTTAMVVWLFKQLAMPVSYSVGAKIPFGDMGQYQPESQYFVYECDEFDRNFLAYSPYMSLITGVAWDHHEIFPTRRDYQQAFVEFIDQSGQTFLWQQDATYLKLEDNSVGLTVLDSNLPSIKAIGLAGLYNRLDAWLAIQAVASITHEPPAKLMAIMNHFPGLSRRMEPIVPGLYTDYAHTPDKIRGAMSAALELADTTNKRLVVIYEPLTNRRQHYMIDDYQDCFSGAAKLYWLPSYLAREDANQPILTPAELIAHLTDQNLAEPAEQNDSLKQIIIKHLENGDMVVAMNGGGGGGLDEWLRLNFQA